MGALFGVLAVVGAAVLVLPRVLRKSTPEESETRTKTDGERNGAKSFTPATATESPSRRFAAAAQRVGSGGAVAPEPLREASTGWQPEMQERFHQTTAYPEPPVPYEAAEDQLRSGSRPAVKAAKPISPPDGAVRTS